MTYRNIFILFLFISTTCFVGCQPENPDKRTDAITKLAFRYFNENKPDSVYQLTDTGFRKIMTRAMFMSAYKERLATMLPFTNVNFVAGNDSASYYQINGKIYVNCYISLDKLGKIKAFGIMPYQDGIKHAAMDADGRKVDTIAHKIIDMMQHKQAANIYRFAGDSFKSKMSENQWRDLAIRDLAFVPPLPPAVFLRSEGGVNVYASGIFRIGIGAIDNAGKFNTFYFQIDRQHAEKSQKALTDNKMKTQLDSVVAKVVSPYIQTWGNVGISAAVLYKGNTYFYNYGERKIGQNRLPDNHTLYDIDSITKTFTSTLLAIAINQKKITPETSITKYLPDSVANNPELKNITFKELANHTSGFARDASNYRETITDINQPYGNYDIRAMFSFLKGFKQVRQPGTKYEYSNLAVSLLGVLLERIYQKPYPELVSQYITTPLKMNETVFAIDTLKAKDLAQGYDGFIEPVPYFKLNAMRSAGIIKSSTADLITYAKAQLSTTDPTLNAGLKLTHQVTFDNGFSVVGLGWHYFPDSKTVLQHAGATFGYRSCVCIDLNKQIAVVVLTNNASTGDEVGRNLIKAIQATKN